MANHEKTVTEPLSHDTRLIPRTVVTHFHLCHLMWMEAARRGKRWPHTHARDGMSHRHTSLFPSLSAQSWSPVRQDEGQMRAESRRGEPDTLAENKDLGGRAAGGWQEGGGSAGERQGLQDLGREEAVRKGCRTFLNAALLAKTQEKTGFSFKMLCVGWNGGLG